MAQAVTPTINSSNRKVRKIVVNNVDYSITTDEINLVFNFVYINSSSANVSLVKGDIKEAYASFINSNGIPINISAKLVFPLGGRIYNADKITFYQDEHEGVPYTGFKIQFSGLASNLTYVEGSSTYDAVYDMIYIQGSFTDDDFYCEFMGSTSYEMTPITTPSSPGDNPVIM